MGKSKILLYLLGIFIVTIMLVVFLQYNSNRNVNQLIDGNQELLTELQRRITIHSLREDLYYISAEERKMVNQPFASVQPEISHRRTKIAAEISYLKKLEGNNPNPGLVKLDSLVYGLLSFHTNVLDSLSGNREKQAKMIMSGRADSLMNEVVETSRQLNISRDERLANLIETTDNNGLEAKKWGIILALLVIAASIYTFFFITNKIRVQRQLIDQLNDSEKKVREAAGIKEKFMANMSHEIRTPMNAMLGFTQLLQREPLNERSAEYVSSIQASGEHLLSIVNDVLDFSSMEAGMLKLKSRSFSLRILLNSLERMFSEKAKQQNILFYVNIHDSVPDVITGDPVRLRQIMVNIIGNAIKFTPSGSVHIRVRNEGQTGDLIKINFSVRDTGIGIPADKIANVFERFNQVDEDANRRFGGTGLGLSIVKQLVEIQNGQIHISSEINKGTEVNISIPYKFEKSQAPMPAIEKDYAEDMNDHEREITILVVEDNLMNQLLMKHLLAGWKLDFTIVSNGTDAIQALRNRPYHLVLMDIQMPGLDGYATTEKIRNELGSSIPIIAMTAHAMKGEEGKCLSRGMNAYISKPVQEKDLIRLIRKYALDYLSSSMQDTRTFQTIDLKYLEEIAAGKSDFIEKMIGQFLQQGKKELEALKNAFDGGDYASVKAIAHNLKTSVAFVGLAPKLELPLSYIENRVTEEEDGKFMVIAIYTVKATCDKALEEAKQYLSEHSLAEIVH